MSDADRDRLEAALRDLKAAVRAYEPFLGRELVADQPVPVHDFDAMRSAQEAVQAAEDRLWRLREEVLGERRPPSALSALATIDWFSDEDAVYDDLPEPNAP
jgi:hypothetical protein